MKCRVCGTEFPQYKVFLWGENECPTCLQTKLLKEQNELLRQSNATSAQIASKVPKKVAFDQDIFDEDCETIDANNQIIAGLEERLANLKRQLQVPEHEIVPIEIDIPPKDKLARTIRRDGDDIIYWIFGDQDVAIKKLEAEIKKFEKQVAKFEKSNKPQETAPQSKADAASHSNSGRDPAVSSTKDQRVAELEKELAQLKATTSQASPSDVTARLNTVLKNKKDAEFSQQTLSNEQPSTQEGGATSPLWYAVLLFIFAFIAVYKWG